MEAAADYPWRDAFAWAEGIVREKRIHEYLLTRIAWATMYSPLAAQGAKDTPEAPEPPDWMLE